VRNDIKKCNVAKNVDEIYNLKLLNMSALRTLFIATVFCS